MNNYRDKATLDAAVEREARLLGSCKSKKHHSSSKHHSSWDSKCSSKSHRKRKVRVRVSVKVRVNRRRRRHSSCS